MNILECEDNRLAVGGCAKKSLERFKEAKPLPGIVCDGEGCAFVWIVARLWWSRVKHPI
jgi:hypothetical protein